MTPNSTTRALCIALPAAVVAVGCTSLEERVPPVGSVVLGSAQAQGFLPEQVARGREVYLNACTRCHSALSIAGHSAAEWESILRTMNEKSGLSTADGAAVRAYVLAARHAAAVPTR